MRKNGLYVLLAISVILLVAFLVIAFVFGTSISSNQCSIWAPGEKEEVEEVAGDKREKVEKKAVEGKILGWTDRWQGV